MILVTGAAGYIGSHICEKLQKKKIDYIAVDNLSSGSLKNINNKKKFYKIDFSSNKTLSIIKKKKIQIIIHSGAFTFPSESEIKKKKYYNNNIKKTKKFIDYCKKANVKKFIFFSSSNVYKFNINNSSLVKPANYYGYTKLHIEKYIKKKSFNNLIILRLFNIAGFIKGFNFFEYKTKYRRIMPSICSSVIENSKIYIYGKKTPRGFYYSKRDYLHIDDFVKLIIILLKKNIKYKIFDIGSCKAISLKKIISIFEKITKKKINYSLKEKRIGELDYTCCLNKGIQKQANWKPTKNIESIVKSALKWKKQ